MNASRLSRSRSGSRRAAAAKSFSPRRTAALGAMVVAAGGVFSFAGCASDHHAATASATADEEVGQITMPLVTQVNGHAYRLRNIYIYIWGPQTSTQLYDSGDTGLTALSTTLSTGTYTAYLYDGWTLERDDGTGAFSRVIANRISNPAVPFTILNGTTSTVSYQFQTDGVIVTIGAGQLRVTAGVEEIAAACTPFGADCGDGAWCPPTTLTAMPRACVTAGATPVGAPCVSPTECVASASCFDLGAGPVCAALCPPEQFGGPCGDSTSTCQAVGTEYGICRPAAPESATP